MRMWCSFMLLLSLLFLRAWTKQDWDTPQGMQTEDNVSIWRQMLRALNDEPKTRTQNASCDGFTLIPNSLTLEGKIIRKVAEARGREACKRACENVGDFHCVGFLLKRPDICYITGFKMRTDYYSTYYTRVCQHGPNCFMPTEGYSSGYEDTITIPETFATSPQMQSYFCMMHAELKKTIVGFDLKTFSNNDYPPACSFVDLDPLTDSSFDFFVRFC